MSFVWSLLFCAILYLYSTSVEATPLDCKCSPNDTCWPGPREWQTFNNTINGKLIRAIPPGAACYKSQPTYDPAVCSSILAQWHTSSFHLQDPISIDYPAWAGDPCLPIFENGTSVNGDPRTGEKGCSIGRYPVYVVNATGPEEVVAAVKWAGERNLRVNIKATGHSVMGRNVAEGSLSIWTRNIRGIKFHSDFQSTSCPRDKGAQMAATVGAGDISYDVIQELAKHGAAAVTAFNDYVGLIGWLTGGGRGPLSSTYGMGSDNLIEANIVTPAGEFLTVNSCENADLFWAIRGGGGGTYGVITSAVIKAFPSPQTTRWTLQAMLLDKSKQDQWWDLIAYFHTLLPDMKQKGFHGAYSLPGYPFTDTLVFIAGFYLYDKPSETVEVSLESFRERLDKMVSAGSVGYSWDVFTGPSFVQAFDRAAYEQPVANIDHVLGSRLLPAQSMKDVEVMARTLRQIGPNLGDSDVPFPSMLFGNLDSNSANINLDTALHPAWRKAVVHLTVVSVLPPGSSSKTLQDARDDMTYNKMATLKSIAPNSGAYFNEMDPFDPDWQNTAFGPNYKRLRNIKKRYDPEGLLWCFSCVGSEDWVEIEDGRLCRADGGICPALSRRRRVRKAGVSRNMGRLVCAADRWGERKGIQ